MVGDNKMNNQYSEFLNNVRTIRYDLYNMEVEDAINDAIQRKINAYKQYHKIVKAKRFPAFKYNGKQYVPVLFIADEQRYPRVAQISGKKSSAKITFTVPNIQMLRLMQSGGGTEEPKKEEK